MAFSEEGSGPNDGPSDDEIAFSGPGAPDVGPSGVDSAEKLPQFFVKSPIDLEVPDTDPNSISMSRVESPRGHAMREDALAAFGDTGVSEQTSPKI